MFNKTSIINTIFKTPWYLMRWVRLIVGLWAISNFAREWKGSDTNTIEYVVLAAGIYFLYKALFNTGCEVRNNNYPEYNNEPTTKEVEFEEIK